MENLLKRKSSNKNLGRLKRIHQKQMTDDRYSLYACASPQSTVPSIQTVFVYSMPQRVDVLWLYPACRVFRQMPALSTLFGRSSPFLGVCLLLGEVLLLFVALVLFGLPTLGLAA